MQENGELQELYSKWWIKDNLNICERREKNDNKAETASELGLASVGGVFAVLAVGLCLAFVVAILEFFWISQKPQLGNDKVSVCLKSIKYYNPNICVT